MNELKQTQRLYEKSAATLELEHVELEMRIEDLTTERDAFEERLNSGLVLSTGMYAFCFFSLCSLRF
jgi:hypothetical protein